MFIHLSPLLGHSPGGKAVSFSAIFSTWYNAWCAGGKAFVEYLRALTWELIFLKPPAYPLQLPTSWTSLNSPACGPGSLNTFSPETVSLHPVIRTKNALSLSRGLISQEPRRKLTGESLQGLVKGCLQGWGGRRAPAREAQPSGTHGRGGELLQARRKVELWEPPKAIAW